jgi:hypothetical protein
MGNGNHDEPCLVLLVKWLSPLILVSFFFSCPSHRLRPEDHDRPQGYHLRSVDNGAELFKWLGHLPGKNIGNHRRILGKIMFDCRRLLRSSLKSAWCFDSDSNLLRLIAASKNLWLTLERYGSRGYIGIYIYILYTYMYIYTITFIIYWDYHNSPVDGFSILTLEWS